MTAKLYIVGIQNFPDTFETYERSFISAFSVCRPVPLKELQNHVEKSFLCPP